MNYQRIYDEFISDRLNKQDSIVGYYEKHHIKPKTLGGDNSKDNIIKLKAQDHYFAHLLLAKIHGGNMWRAHWMMSNSKKYKSSRIMYEASKIEQSKYAGTLAKKYNTGRDKTKEEISKIRDGLKRYYQKNPARKGFKRNLSEQQRALMSIASKERIAKFGHPLKGKKMSSSHLEKLRSYMLSDKNHFKGKPMSEEQKRKIANAQIGELNHAYKKQLYLFKHPEHGCFKGTQNNLMYAFNLKKNGVSRLCRKEYSQHKGWVIVEELGND